MMMDKIHITKERKVITYSDFWRASEYLLKRGQGEERGSYFLFLSSLVFSAFSLEAFLNHIGEHLFNSWGDLEKLRPKAKVNIIAEKLNIKVDYGDTLWQIIPEVIGFRNKIAHGKNTLLREKRTIRANDKYEEIMHEFLFANWQNYATKENAIRVRQRLEEVFKIIHEKANIENDFLFQHGGQLSSAKLVRE